MKTSQLWLACSMVRANVEQLNEHAFYCPFDVSVDGELAPSDGMYEPFDYLWWAVGLRDETLDEAWDGFEKAVSAFVNSDDDGIGSFTFKPQHGGSTYYFRKSLSAGPDAQNPPEAEGFVRFDSVEFGGIEWEAAPCSWNKHPLHGKAIKSYCSDGDGIVQVQEYTSTFEVLDQCEPVGAFKTLEEALTKAIEVLRKDYPAIYEAQYIAEGE